MWKKFVLLTALTLFSFNLFAHGTEWIAAAVLFKDAKWTPVQISFWPVHLCSPRTDVYGLAVSPGLVGFADKVYGISSGIIFLQNENFGVTAGIYSFGVKNNGISLGIINSWESNDGISIGAANCIYNNSGRNILQIGVFNYAKNGLQIGIFNTTSNGGVQIGLLNYNPKSYIPWLPFVNWDMGREEK